jgi:DHA1 family bicyclomycin/chloramphenicol resistance-like MFS transporter
MRLPALELRAKPDYDRFHDLRLFRNRMPHRPHLPHLLMPRWMLPLLLAGLATLGPFSIDTYMPSFPAIGESLNATPLQVQQTLSVYLLAFGVMILFHGTLSDSFGRRPVILVSLGMFALASAGCVVSYDINHLLFFRALQGLSAGAGMVVGRAIIRDCYSGHQAQRLMSQVTMIFGIAPAVAPIIGGWLHLWFGWHSVFVFLALLGVGLLGVSYRYLPETLPETERQPLHPIALLKRYRKVSADRRFLLLTAAVALNFAGFFLYIASAPVFVIHSLGLQENQFAWLFVPGVSGVVAGAFLSGRMAGKVSPRITVGFGYLLMVGAATLNVAYNLSVPPAIPWAVLPIMLYSTGMSLAMPSISLLVLDLHPASRGLVASMQGFVQTMLNAVVAGVISPLLSPAPIWLAWGMAGFVLLGGLVWLSYVHLYRAELQHA